MLQQTNPHTLRLLEFADFIESLPDECINTAGWCNSCGTTACYAGHAILQYGTPEERDQMINVFKRTIDPFETARRILDIKSLQAECLFLRGDLNKKGAVKLLRQFAFDEPRP